MQRIPVTARKHAAAAAGACAAVLAPAAVGFGKVGTAGVACASWFVAALPLVAYEQVSEGASTGGAVLGGIVAAFAPEVDQDASNDVVAWAECASEAFPVTRACMQHAAALRIV